MEQESPNLEDQDDLSPDAIEALRGGMIDDDLTEEEYESYGRKVKKRIDKEVSKRKALEDQLENTETEKQRMARELKEARQRLSEYEENDDKSLADREKDVLERRNKALDAGELPEYNELNDELLDIKMERVRRSNRPKIEREPETPPASDKPKVAKAAQDWIDSQDWINVDEEKTATAAKIERQLKNEGYSYNDPETYKELDRRLAAYDAPPATDDDDLGLDDDPPPRQTAVGGVNRDTAPRTPRGKGVLTRDDLGRMKRAGFDPSDPSHRKAWLDRNKPL